MTESTIETTAKESSKPTVEIATKETSKPTVETAAKETSKPTVELGEDGRFVELRTVAKSMGGSESTLRLQTHGLPVSFERIVEVLSDAGKFVRFALIPQLNDFFQVTKRPHS